MASRNRKAARMVNRRHLLLLRFLSSLCLISSYWDCRADNLDEWTLKSVSPFVWTIGANSNCLVAVANDSDVLRSTDGDTWVQANPSQNPFAGDKETSFREVLFGNGTFVIVGIHYSGPYQDAVLTSPDGVNWTASTQVLSNALYGAIFTNGLFIAVGGQGNIWYSTNGLNWLHSPLVTSTDLYAVGFGQGLFVAVGGNFPITILTSPDGMTWSAQDPGSVVGVAPQAIAHGQGRFVAVGAGYMTSTDGTNWLQADFPWTDPNVFPVLTSVTFAQNTFLAVGSARNNFGSYYGIVFTSPDGQTWTQKSTIPRETWHDAVFWNDSFIVVGDGIMRSQPFSGPKLPPTLIAGPTSIMALADQSVTLSATGACYPPLRFQWQLDGQAITGQTNSSMALAAALTNAGVYTLLATNSNGSVTSAPASVIVVDRVKPVPPFQSPATQGHDYGLGVLVSGTSTAGYRWRVNQQNIANATNSTYGFINIQASQAARYDVVVSNAVGMVTNTPLYLTVEPYSEHPLYHWLDRTPPGLPGLLSPDGLRAVAYGNGGFVSVGSIGGSDFGVILSSQDGASWTLQAPRQSFYVLNLYDLAFGNGVFVAVGYSSFIYSSTNGVDWGLRMTGDYATYLDRVVYTNGYFWAGGSQTYRSSDGVNWQVAGPWPGYSAPPAYGGGIWATVSNSPSGVFFSTNAPNWTLGIASDAPLYDVAFGRGIFVAVGRGGTILQSESIVKLDLDDSKPPNLALRGLVGRQYAVEHGSLLTGTNWTEVATILLTNNPTLVPVVPNQTQDFFRIKLLP